MVLGILTAIAACPAIIGTTEAVRQGQRKSAKEQHRGVKNNLIVSCYRPTKLGSEINGGSVVLRNNKVCAFLSLFLHLAGQEIRAEPARILHLEPNQPIAQVKMIKT
jgi:hypothetical protein